MDEILDSTDTFFKVGDDFRIIANAIDLLGSALEYKFKIKRDCVDSETLQDWSSSDTLDYTFQVSDVTNCTEIIIQVRNSDGIFLDGQDSDIEYTVEFSSQPTWTPLAIDSSTPSKRSAFTAIWSGSKMIVWGGNSDGDNMNDGSSYNPTTNSWSTLSNVNSPSIRNNHSAVWSGTKMIIWGGEHGQNLLNTGGIYDPSTDTWSSTAIDMNTPSARTLHTAVWTGSKTIIWGGYSGLNTATNTGGIYDPTNNSWSSMSTVNGPSPRYYHSAVWTGSKMIIWGGFDANNALDDGGIYDPATDSWTQISSVNSPSARLVHNAAWSASKMIIWGGMNTNGTNQYNTGAIYDPALDVWTTMSTTNAPTGRSWGPSSAWLGDSLFIWGGYTDSGSTSTNTGGIFSSKTLNWKSTTINASTPSARAYAKSVWTGSKVIVWGGSQNNDGAIFAP